MGLDNAGKVRQGERGTMARRNRFGFGVAAAILAAGATASGDGGAISFSAEADLFEPGQNAIVAWNGTREVMILSIDVRASVPTKALEIVPLPSEPTLEAGTHLSFLYADYLVDRAIEQLRPRSDERQRLYAAGDDLGAEQNQAVAVTTHERIGPHDITAIRVDDYTGLAAWLGEFFRRQGVERELPAALPGIVGHYMRDGVRHFALDVMDLVPDVRTVDPIVYSFDSDRLWYPLHISSLYKGETVINLVTITSQEIPADRMPEGVKRFEYVVQERGKIDDEVRSEERHVLPAIELVPARQERLGEAVRALFDGGNAWMQVWKYEGDLAVDTDVSIGM